MTTKSVVCFDIGIKNLAFCQLAFTEATKQYELIGWDNVNLLATDADAVPVKSCFGCKSKATYEGGSCKRHCVKKPFQDLSGNILQKFPSVAVLREILLQKEPTIKKSLQRTELIEVLRKYYALPVQHEKKQKVAQVDLCYLHDCMRKFVLANSEAWKNATEICLENQPAFKNPQMKSVQMLLFATIRDVLQPTPPPIRLVHASMKVKGATTGDAGYDERKKGSKDRVKELIGKVIDPKVLVNKYNTVTKKDDMADAFCMAVDALKRS